MAAEPTVAKVCVKCHEFAGLALTAARGKQALCHDCFEDIMRRRKNRHGNEPT